MAEAKDFHERVMGVHEALGIPADYAARCGLPLVEEPRELVTTEPDYYGRQQRLTPEAFQAWSAMRDAAAAEGVTIHLISAFRSLEYQQQLIERKIQGGQSIDTILAVNAAPGFSEHHSGRAIDVGTLDCDALVEAFEHTEAFAWLQRRAAEFGYRLSFPRDNPHGIAYEPWHWCFVKTDSEV